MRLYLFIGAEAITAAWAHLLSWRDVTLVFVCFICIFRIVVHCIQSNKLSFSLVWRNSWSKSDAHFSFSWSIQTEVRRRSQCNLNAVMCVMGYTCIDISKTFLWYSILLFECWLVWLRILLKIFFSRRVDKSPIRKLTGFQIVTTRKNMAHTLWGLFWLRKSSDLISIETT